MGNKLCFMTTAVATGGHATAASEKQGVAEAARHDEASLLDEVQSMPGGEGVRLCIQCGVCSASCPNVAQMDFSPRKTIAMIRAERRGDVFSSNTPWICASCYMCTVRCPRGVKPTELMHVLERLATHHGLRSKKVFTPAMYTAFVDSVKNNGRVHEVGLMRQYFFSTNPLAALKITSVGLGLLRHGRMSIKASKIKGINQIQAMLKKANALEGVK